LRTAWANAVDEDQRVLAFAVDGRLVGLDQKVAIAQRLDGRLSVART
jgi:hypothetical protein